MNNREAHSNVSRILFFLMVMGSVCVYAADVTFFALSDLHYGAFTSHDSTSIITRCPQVSVINTLPGTSYPSSIGGVVEKPRGIIMAGDLINDGAVAEKYPTQWANYIADFGVNGEGRCKFPVFEAVGNHDVNLNLFVFNQVKERNQIRKKLKHISNISSNGYHYSWDWDGVHFVNVNLFPGNVWHGEADTYGRGHDPLYARDFLIEDLCKNVGTSGRPVIVVQHFRPIDENWWTYSAADKYQKILQEYNVILIMNGHQGGGVNNTWRGINWASSNGELDVFRITPDNRLTGFSRMRNEWGQPLQEKIFFSYASSGLSAVVNNGDWVSNVSAAGATVSGKILYEAASPTKARIYWGTNDGGTAPGNWQHSQDIGVQKAGMVFSTEIKDLMPWTNYFYRCRVANSKGEAWAAASIPFITRGILPRGWKTMFIGYEQRPWGGAHYKNGTFTVRGSGRDIGEPGEPIDNFQYAFTPLNGDGGILARVVTMTGKNRDPKVGIMIRRSLVDDAENVSVLVDTRGNARMLYRTQAGGRSVSSERISATVPVWLKLIRKGNTFTAYSSTDGTTWTRVGEAVEIEMPADIYAGLAVTAGNRDGSQHHTATFDYVRVKSERAKD